MASSVQEKLRDCSNFGLWLDKAIEILNSPENIHAGTKVLERKSQLERTKMRMKETAKRVIKTPKAALKRVSPKR